MKDFFCRLFAPWKAGDQFESADAFYGFVKGFAARHDNRFVIGASLVGCGGHGYLRRYGKAAINVRVNSERDDKGGFFNVNNGKIAREVEYKQPQKY